MDEQKAKKAFGSHTIQQTSGWHWHCLGALVGMKANSVQMWPLLILPFEACWFSGQKAREEGDWRGISMELSKLNYFKLILYHTGIMIVLGGRSSWKHKRCSDPLYRANFSITSVGHCVEILWADRLMKHIMMQAHQFGAGKCRTGWIWQKKPHVYSLCRDSLGASIPRPFWGGSMELPTWTWLLLWIFGPHFSCEKLMEWSHLVGYLCACCEDTLTGC